MYIYIYREREKERERGRFRDRDRGRWVSSGMKYDNIGKRKTVKSDRHILIKE